MVIFNEELGKYFANYHWSENRDLGVIEEEELNKIIQIMRRVSTGYSCSTSEGFTYEENAFAKLLEHFYSEAFQDGVEYAAKEYLDRTEKQKEKLKKLIEDL